AGCCRLVVLRLLREFLGEVGLDAREVPEAVAAGHRAGDGVTVTVHEGHFGGALPLNVQTLRGAPRPRGVAKALVQVINCIEAVQAPAKTHFLAERSGSP